MLHAHYGSAVHASVECECDNRRWYWQQVLLLRGCGSIASRQRSCIETVLAELAVAWQAFMPDLGMSDTAVQLVRMQLHAVLQPVMAVRCSYAYVPSDCAGASFRMVAGMMPPQAGVGIR